MDVVGCCTVLSGVVSRFVFDLCNFLVGALDLLGFLLTVALSYTLSFQVNINK